MPVEVTETSEIGMGFNTTVLGAGVTDLSHSPLQKSGELISRVMRSLLNQCGFSEESEEGKGDFAIFCQLGIL